MSILTTNRQITKRCKHYTIRFDLCCFKSTDVTQKAKTVPQRQVGGCTLCPLHKQWSQQTNMFCMTNRYLVTLTGKTNPGFWWLMTEVFDMHSKKKCCLPLSLEKKHWPIWITDCVDWWCLCHLLLSLWADSVCGVQSESEVSSQSHSLSIVDWNIHSAALATLRICLFFLSPYHSSRRHWL